MFAVKTHDVGVNEARDEPLAFQVPEQALGRQPGPRFRFVGSAHRASTLAALLAAKQ